MSKYNPLSARLAGHAGAEWRASFAELEEVLGFPLPKGARAGKAWWKNDPAATQARAWTEGGWEATDVDHAGGQVTFRRTVAPEAAPSAPTTPSAPAATPAATDEPAILARLDATPKWGMAIIAGSVALVAGLGALAIRGVMRRR